MSSPDGNAERAAASPTRLTIVLAILWFIPGIWWGLPENSQDYVRSFWAIDEVGPKGSLNAILKLLGEDTFVTPQYPLAHYFVQALFVWPYHLAVLLADNVGLPKQTDSLAVLALLHRLPSALMSAGTVLAAAVLAKRLAGHASAWWPTAIAAATIGPLVYYARTSNVDAGALFWAIAALIPASDAIRDRLTTRRAVLLALCAAAGVATKDQQYAYFAGLGIVLALHHLTRKGNARAVMARLRPLLIAGVISAGAYLVVSGALLMPAWFAEHVAFIRAGSSAVVPQELRRLIGTYFENTATIEGYSQLAVDIVTLLVSAVGIPVCLLAIGGVITLYKRNAWLLAVLVVPVLALFAGVIIPVRFVLPRFLLPVDVVLCILAGIGYAAAASVPRWRVLSTATVVAAIGWGVVRGADLTWQMHHDVRYDVAGWLDRNLQKGDTLAYYGAKLKLPRLRRDIEVTLAPDQYLPEVLYGGRGPATQTPPFIIVIPQQVAEREHEWTLPDSIYRQLLDGSRGYEQVLAVQTPALFPRHRRSAPSVNSPVRIFARRDVVSRLVDPRRIDVASPAQPRAAREAIPQRDAQQQRTVLVGATLLDGRGGEPLTYARIVVENGRFTCVSGANGCPAQDGDQAVNLGGRWITPGLIDTHVHLPFVLAPNGLRRNQRLRFAFGITTVRDAGSRATDSLLAARAVAESGDEPTPRIVVSSLLLPEDATRVGVSFDSGLVKPLVARGVEAIKIKEPFENENWRSQIRAARAAGVPSFGHTWGSVHEEFTRAAIAEGISGISHIMAIPLGTQPVGTVLTPPDSAKDFWPWEKKLWLSIDSARRDSLLSDMVSANVWLEPTLVTEYHFGRALQPPQAAYFLGRVPTAREWLNARIAGLRGVALAADTVPPPRYPATWTQQSAFVGDFIRRGGMVVSGADGKSTAIDLHEEMRLIGDVAGAPMAGLMAATQNAAIALNRRDLGTIEPGKLADAVVYDADPLGRVGASLQISRVIKGGVVYDAERLRAEFREEFERKEVSAWRGRMIRGVPLLLLGLAMPLVLWRVRKRRTRLAN